MKFYVCKFPIFKDFGKDDKPMYWPVGTAFRIECLNGDCFELSPVSKGNSDTTITPCVSVSTLRFAFNEQEFIND